MINANRSGNIVWVEKRMDIYCIKMSHFTLDKLCLAKEELWGD